MRIHCVVASSFAFTLLAASAPAQHVDIDFDAVTGPSDVDLVVVRERAYGAGGVDLTSIGIAGSHDFVQSIYVRARHGAAQTRREVQGRLVFSPSITVLGVITDGAMLGGSADDGVLTAADALFGIGPDPDRYSAPFRGLELLGEAEHACLRPNGTIDFNLLMRRDDVDDFRVIIDYGTSFPSGETLDVELAVDSAIPGAIAHELGLRVGDSGGAVLGSGDLGEVAGYSRIPLTAAVPGVPNAGNEFDPLAGILLNRTGGPISADHLEMYDPTKRVLHTHSRRGVRSQLSRGPLGYIYGNNLNFAGFTMLDLGTGSVGRVPVSGLESPVTLVAGYESGDSLALCGHVSGVNSDYKVHRVDVKTGAITAIVTIPVGSVVNPVGAVWTGGDVHLIDQTGNYATVDFGAGTSNVTPIAGTSGTYFGIESNAAGTRLFAIRQLPAVQTLEIDEIDAANGTVQLSVFTDTTLIRPRLITRDASGHLWISQSTFGQGEVGSMLEIDPSNWSLVETHACSIKWGPSAIRADVNPAPIGTTYCDPAVPNNTGRPGSMFALGSVDVTDNDFHLRAVGLPTSSFGFFVNANATGMAMPPFSQGIVCLGGTSIGRHDNQIMNTGQAGSFTIQVDLTALPQPNLPYVVMPGETWYFQCWHRQPPSTSNWTDAIEVTFQ